MSLTRFYLYRDAVLIPNVVKAEEGFYFDAEPITGCDVTDDEDLKGCLSEALQMENEVVPTPKPEVGKGSLILEALNLKRWHEFEYQSVMYSVYSDENGDYTFYATGRSDKGLWSQDPTRQKVFPAGTPIGEIVEELVAQIRQDSDIEFERQKRLILAENEVVDELETVRKPAPLILRPPDPPETNGGH